MWTNSPTLMVSNNLYVKHTARHPPMHHQHNAGVAENIKSECHQRERIRLGYANRRRPKEYEFALIAGN
jgi:hypothetical protein